MIFAAPHTLSRHPLALRALRTPDRGMERFFQQALARESHQAQVSQDATSWTLQVDLPGVSREQLDIQIDGSRVTIDTVADAPRQYHLAYELGQEVAPQGSSAKLDLGVLTLKLQRQLPVDQRIKLQVD